MEIFAQRVARKLSGQVWEIRAKFFCTRKNLPTPTPMLVQTVLYALSLFVMASFNVSTIKINVFVLNIGVMYMILLSLVPSEETCETRVRTDC